MAALWSMPVKDWIFVIGVVLFTLLLYGEVMDPAKWYDRRHERAERGLQMWREAVVTLLLIVNFFEFRRGLESVVGLSEAVSWVLAPIGLILVIAADLATWSEGLSRLKWAGVFLLWMTVCAAYIAVVWAQRT
jgi:hypothetical protein